MSDEPDSLALRDPRRTEERMDRFEGRPARAERRPDLIDLPA